MELHKLKEVLWVVSSLGVPKTTLEFSNAICAVGSRVKPGVRVQSGVVGQG